LLPDGKPSGTLQEIKITSPQIQSMLKTYLAEIVEKAFPDFDPVDTIGISITGEVVKLADLRNIFKIRFPIGTSISQAIHELRTMPDVTFADPNGVVAPLFEPNDPYFSQQWNLKDANDHDIDAPEAWDITTGSSSTKIGIIDGGVENWHEDLSGKVSGDAG
jgi:hypothetical protein